MRWPFRRRKPAAEPVPPRPYREWARLAPLAPVGLRPEPEAASALGFQLRLATRWQQPPILETLGHEVSLSAPPGLTSGIVAPVQGYSNAPDLPLLPVAGAPGGAEGQTPKPFIRYDRPRGTAASVASLGAVEPVNSPRSVEPAPADPPPRVAPLVGDLVGGPLSVTPPLETPPVDMPLDEEPPYVAPAAQPPSAVPASVPPHAEEPPAVVPPGVVPPGVVPPAVAPPAEPAPRVRRLGRIGAPLHVDAVPPAVLRPPGSAADAAPDVVKRHADSMGAPLHDEPSALAQPSVPDLIPDVVKRHADSMGAPLHDEPAPWSPGTPSPAALGIPEWFSMPPADADPDDPVRASWSAPGQPDSPPAVPGMPAPPVVTSGEALFAPPIPAGPPSDADHPVRSFRRFGVGRPMEPSTEPPPGAPPEAPPPEPSPPARDDPATPADDSPEPPDLPPAAEFMPTVFSAVPTPDFDPPVRRSAEPPQVEEPPPPVLRHLQADSPPVRMPAASRPLASVQRTLAYLPPAGMSVLPGLAARPEQQPTPEHAPPRAEEAPSVAFMAGDDESPMALPPGVTPWAGYPPPSPHLDEVPTPDLSSLFGVPAMAPPVEDAPPRAPRTDWDPVPAAEPFTTVHDQVFEEPDVDDTDERLDGLAADLYDRIRDRLRRELLVDRERSLMITDWR